jgi:hypothetical protein
MDELGLAVACKRLGIGAKASGVPAVVTGKSAVKPRGRVRGERAQEERAVVTVPG